MSKPKKQNKPAAGNNRQQRRENARQPQKSSSSKPMWLRIVVLALFAIMLLGFVIVPLLH